jgi:hypothetical protein
MFSHRMVSRLSLQRYTADFCLVQQLTGPNCIEFIGALYQHLHLVLRGEELGLRPVQHVPTVMNPFFFMHIEKTAGTTLRE